MVQANYARAAAECDRLARIAQPLVAQGCTAYVRGTTGQLIPAYALLSEAVAGAGPVAPGLTLWAQTRLAEMAARLQRWGDAERHYRDHQQGPEGNARAQDGVRYRERDQEDGNREDEAQPGRRPAEQAVRELAKEAEVVAAAVPGHPRRDSRLGLSIPIRENPSWVDKLGARG